MSFFDIHYFCFSYFIVCGVVLCVCLCICLYVCLCDVDHCIGIQCFIDYKDSVSFSCKDSFEECGAKMCVKCLVAIKGEVSEMI